MTVTATEHNTCMSLFPKHVWAHGHMYTLIQQPHLIGMSIITEKQKENELQFLHVAQLIKYQ